MSAIKNILKTFDQRFAEFKGSCDTIQLFAFDMNSVCVLQMEKLNSESHTGENCI